MEIQANIARKELWKGSIADRLFSFQYHKELEDPSKSNREWVSRLQNVVSALNNEKTRLIGMKPVDAIKQTLVEQGFSQPAKEYEEKLLDVQEYEEKLLQRETQPTLHVKCHLKTLSIPTILL